MCVWCTVYAGRVRDSICEKCTKSTQTMNICTKNVFSASFSTYRSISFAMCVCVRVSVCASIRNKSALKCCENIEKSFKLWFIYERVNKVYQKHFTSSLFRFFSRYFVRWRCVNNKLVFRSFSQFFSVFSHSI